MMWKMIIPSFVFIFVFWELGKTLSIADTELSSGMDKLMRPFLSRLYMHCLHSNMQELYEFENYVNRF